MNLRLLLFAMLLVAGPLPRGTMAGKRKKSPPPPPPPPPSKKPNIILILTDDQDYVMNSTHPYYLPMLHKHLRLQGTEIPHFITSVGNCCPSRTTLLTGRHCHNTNLTANDPPYGGFQAFKANKLDKNYLPLWLQAAGYQTFWVGKALNGFDSLQADRLGCLPGWSHLMPAVAPPTAAYWAEFQASISQRPPVYLKFYYTNCQYYEKKTGFPDDNLFQRAFELIEDATDKGSPFFLKLSVSAPHDGPVDNLPRIAERFLQAFPGLQVPKGPNYGKPTDPRFEISKQRPLWWNLADSDARYRARAQSLLAIDENLDKLVTKLECLGILDNTYIIWTSDNGFKLGQHNIPQEKWTYFEEDVALPFFIRGPGVPRGVYASTVQAAMVDVTATIVDIAGAKPTGTYRLDGAPIPLDLISSLNPTPNSPFYNYTGAYWNAPSGTDITVLGSQMSTDMCVRQTRPPPMPPQPPRPPPCKGAACKIKGYTSDDDDTEDSFLRTDALYDVAVPVPSEAAATAAAAEGGVSDNGGNRRLIAAGDVNSGVAGGRLSNWSNLALIEQWKTGKTYRGKDYRALRACMPPDAAISQSPRGILRTGNACYKYIVYCNINNAYGDLRLNQLFNLTVDQAEVNDLLLKLPLPSYTRRLVDRLDAALTVMSYCSGSTCTQPFSRIHPDGSVVNLAEAMDPAYDSLYAGFQKLDFYKCAEYYDPANEIPDPRLVPVEWTAPPPKAPLSYALSYSGLSTAASASSADTATEAATVATATASKVVRRLRVRGGRGSRRGSRWQ
ncbi:hypothetical protein Agub_g2494 [Astrephomene gubernaculifera]|uniref:Sulfatase N-terminal domain-containing protein n=1 Tax=Astrephomene gubernaculifera TaxID=47775 RepID=A0AAD3DH54_9CHLO|nr:hypothetical protein Agub_g2494 [Astrephomene gubernaculifera]